MRTRSGWGERLQDQKQVEKVKEVEEKSVARVRMVLVLAAGLFLGACLPMLGRAATEAVPAGSVAGGAQSPVHTGIAYSMEAPADVELSTETGETFWQEAVPIVAEGDTWGKPVGRHRTTIYSRWTRDNLYFLFVCPYEELYLKPNPVTTAETNELWNWDVAEVFIGWEFANIKRYKEFEMSPQGEWVDLDIDREHPLPEGGWKWNSGFQVAARIDGAKRIWYGAMKIPMSAIAGGPVAAGARFRINFYRCEGPKDKETKIAWQQVMSENFHTPERFGILELVGERR